ncbi:MAG: N-acylneuraminate cytidylyltransferase [Hungatella sp.]|nr:N-acylneuraminate cytidylyltransferase [Hungatella sp.]
MNAAFIPVRGGSKSIPLKNIKIMNGKPLVYWTIKAACECRFIDKVYVATDSLSIKETVESIKDREQGETFAKVEVIGRSAESASDTASTESAMLEFAAAFEFDNIALIQATSPLLEAADLNRGFQVFYEDDVDSVLSVVPQKRFNWEKDENGYAYPTNYDVLQRPRRQDFNGYLVENGAFYITSKVCLINSANRLSGKIKAVEMSEDTFFEIDEPEDWVTIEGLMKKREVADFEKIPEIKLFLTDCDGCLTDGGMYYSENGDELKKFNTRDGMGFALLKKQGILTGIITSENVELNRRRAGKLNLDFLEQGCIDKITAVTRICEECGIDLRNVAYVGDDMNDLDLIKSVGFGCCPSDAVEQIKDVAKYVTKTKGGGGVIREIVDFLLSNVVETI